LVEDEERLQRSIKQLLERAGYVVLAASHGMEALRIVEEREGKIDLLLTDVGLPRLRGPDVAQRLADRRPEIKVLYMSGFGEDSLRPDEALRLAGRFLQKPFRKDSLLRKVEDMLGERLER
jgi:two-component system cell cycle sensor histidine kinase/response regulator CckA